MKKSVLFSAIVLSALAILPGCKEKKKVEEQTNNKVLVKTVAASSEVIDNIAEFTSNIEPFQQNNLCPSTAVRIDEIRVDVGDRVSKGQLLVVMDQTQYKQSKIQVEQLEADYERLKNVYEAGGATKQQLDNAKNNLDIQKMALKLLADNIELRSPINGVVTGRYFEPGDMFSMSPNASGAASVLQLMQIDKLKVTIPVSEAYFTQVKNGMPVEIAVDLFPDKKFEGKVSLIYPSIDAATRTFMVEVTIPNGNKVLRPGMFSRTTLYLGQSNGVMIKDIAVQKQVGSNEKYVFVVKDGVAHRTTITTGRQVGDKINVLSGVNEGDQVVVAGMSKLSDGAEVEVKNN